MLGTREKLKACQGQYETMELLRAIEPRYMQEGFLVREVTAEQQHCGVVTREMMPTSSSPSDASHFHVLSKHILAEVDAQLVSAQLSLHPSTSQLNTQLLWNFSSSADSFSLILSCSSGSYNFNWCFFFLFYSNLSELKHQNQPKQSDFPASISKREQKPPTKVQINKAV